MRIILLYLFLVLISVSAIGKENSCVSKKFEYLKLSNLASSDTPDELRVYEIGMFDFSIMNVYRIYPNHSEGWFGFPQRKRSSKISNEIIKEFEVPSGIAEVFRFQFWTTDYESLVSDGVSYSVEYKWLGKHGCLFFDNPDNAASIDAQMLTRLIESIKN